MYLPVVGDRCAGLRLDTEGVTSCFEAITREIPPSGTIPLATDSGNVTITTREGCSARRSAQDPLGSHDLQTGSVAMESLRMTSARPGGTSSVSEGESNGEPHRNRTGNRSCHSNRQRADDHSRIVAICRVSTADVDQPADRSNVSGSSPAMRYPSHRRSGPRSISVPEGAVGNDDTSQRIIATVNVLARAIRRSGRVVPWVWSRMQPAEAFQRHCRGRAPPAGTSMMARSAGLARPCSRASERERRSRGRQVRRQCFLPRQVQPEGATRRSFH